MYKLTTQFVPSDSNIWCNWVPRWKHYTISTPDKTCIKRIHMYNDSYTSLSSWYCTIITLSPFALPPQAHHIGNITRTSIVKINLGTPRYPLGGEPRQTLHIGVSHRWSEYPLRRFLVLPLVLLRAAATLWALSVHRQILKHLPYTLSRRGMMMLMLSHFTSCITRTAGYVSERGRPEAWIGGGVCM